MKTLPLLPDVSIEEVIANSFRDYHVKGFDYICIRRSPEQTVKLYFFDGDVSKLPEVVNPHDHRYDFETLCVAGAVQNFWFKDAGQYDGKCQQIFQRFEYRTPLNGGDGFQHVGLTALHMMHAEKFRPGQSYWMNAEEIHTIRLVENETVIALVQHEDRVKDGVPTFTFTRDREPPSLNGLYGKFTADQVFAKLVTLQRRAPGIVLPRIV
jgi:hypothetical protein